MYEETYFFSQYYKVFTDVMIYFYASQLLREELPLPSLHVIRYRYLTSLLLQKKTSGNIDAVRQHVQN